MVRVTKNAHRLARLAAADQGTTISAVVDSAITGLCDLEADPDRPDTRQGHAPPAPPGDFPAPAGTDGALPPST